MQTACTDLTLLEFEDEVLAAFQAWGTDAFRSSNHRTVLFEPRAQVQFIRQRLSYGSSSNYFGATGHRSGLEFSQRIVKSLRPLLRFQDPWGGAEGYRHAFILYVRLLIHECVFLTEVVDQAVNMHSPERIKSPAAVLTFSEPYLTSRDRLLGSITRLYCDAHGLAWQPLAFRSPRQKRASLSDPFKAWIGRALLPIMARIARFRARKRHMVLGYNQQLQMTRIMTQLCERIPNMVTGYLGLQNLRKDVQRNMRDAAYWSFLSLPFWSGGRPGKAFSRQIKTNIARFRDFMSTNRESFVYKKVDLREVLWAYTDQVLSGALGHLYLQSQNIHKILKTCHPSLVLSQNALEVGYHLGEICRQMGTPALLITHGSHVPTQDPWAAVEWHEHSFGLINTHYEYVAVQTPWAQQYLATIPVKSKPIVTGPLLFGKRPSQVRTDRAPDQGLVRDADGRHVLLHAGTPKLRGRRRLYVYETVEEYVANIQSLIRVVNKMPGLYLAVRFRPMPRFGVRDLSSLLPPAGNWAIYADGAFEDLLVGSDLLVSYSSTTIEESLQHHVPVLQYDPQGKYGLIPAQELSPDSNPQVNACYFVGSEKTLGWGLQWLTDHHLGRTDIPDGIWQLHAFEDQEMVDIAEYFKPQCLDEMPAAGREETDAYV